MSRKGEVLCVQIQEERVLVPVWGTFSPDREILELCLDTIRPLRFSMVENHRPRLWAGGDKRD